MNIDQNLNQLIALPTPVDSPSRQKFEHVFCGSDGQFAASKTGHISCPWPGPMVDADFPRRAFIQTFDDVPRDYQCPSSKILCPSLWPQWLNLGLGKAIQQFYLWRSSLKFPKFCPKNIHGAGTVRPVVAELKRRGVEVQLRTTESVPLGAGSSWNAGFFDIF